MLKIIIHDDFQLEVFPTKKLHVIITPAIRGGKEEAVNEEQVIEDSKEAKVKEDDIDFSNKACWEHSWKELFVVLGKRILSLPSKIIGFKPLCFLISTWLLIQRHIRDWIWFCIVVIVLFGIEGLKVVARWKEIDRE